MISSKVIALAQKHLQEHYYKFGRCNESAKLCLIDALALYRAGDYSRSKQRALASLKYSVGLFHQDYISASE